METQGVQGSKTGYIYENPQSVQINTYENDEIRASQGSVKSQRHEQEIALNGKMSRAKTVLLVICLIVTIACAISTIVLFTKVMNNEKQQEKSSTRLNALSTNFNVTSLKQKVDMKLVEGGVHFNNTIDNLMLKLLKLLPVRNCAQTFKNTLTSEERVYCNGWTVFQRRMDGSIPDFHNKTWEEYSEGFGNMNGEFWLGLRKLHEITRQGGCRLRVDLQSFDSDTAYAEYSQFYVANEANLYRLTVGSYSGTAGDSLNPGTSKWSINGMAFSTIERDNDRSPNNCATKYNTGGWWNNACFSAVPNGVYGETRPSKHATKWGKWKGDDPMKFIQMGVRCDYTLI